MKKKYSIKEVDKVTGRPSVSIDWSDEYGTHVVVDMFDRKVHLAILPDYTEDYNVYVSIDEEEKEPEKPFHTGVNDKVFMAIKARRRGLSPAQIIDITGLKKIQVRNALYQLKNQGKATNRNARWYVVK